MSKKESTTGCNSTSNSLSNPPPTGAQVRQRHKSWKSQREHIVDELKRNGSISSTQMLKMGFHSGTKRISELIESGYLIEKSTDWTKNGVKTYHYKGHKGHKGDSNG